MRPRRWLSGIVRPLNFTVRLRIFRFMRTALIVLTGAYLAGCTSTHDLSKGPGVLGGGVEHIEVKPGLYSITAQTNWAPWSNYPAAQRAWRNAADALCGKGKYQELGISQAAKDTGMPHFLRAAAYIVTERRGYALCNDSQITFADAAVLIDKAQNDAARHD